MMCGLIIGLIILQILVEERLLEIWSLQTALGIGLLVSTLISDRLTIRFFITIKQTTRPNSKFKDVKDKAGTKEMIMIKNLMVRRSEINGDTKRPMPSAVFSRGKLIRDMKI